MELASAAAPNSAGSLAGAPVVGVGGWRGGVAYAYRLIRRRLRLAIALAVVLTALAALVIVNLPARYTAETTLLLDPRGSTPGELASDTDSLPARGPSDASVVRTQTALLLSPELLQQLAERLGPDWEARTPDPGQSFAREVGRFLERWGLPHGGLQAWIEGVARPARPPSVDEMAEHLRRSLTIVGEAGSYLVRIQADAPDPVLAAQAANTLAELYVAGQRKIGEQARDSNVQWLGDRLAELRANAISSENALEAFRTEHQLGAESANDALDRQAEQLSRDLLAANTELIRTRTGLDQLEAAASRGATQTTASFMSSSVIQALRAQEASLLTRRAQLQQLYGPRHPEMVTIDAELTSVRAKVRAEADRIVAAARAEVEVAQAQVTALEQQLANLHNQREQRAEATGRLAELARQARAAGDVYQQFLAQFTAGMARANMGVPQARIVSQAQPPTSPSGPPRQSMLATAGLGSLGAGLLAVLLVGYVRGGFSHTGQLAAATGIPAIGPLPELTRREKSAWARATGTAAAGTVMQLAYVLATRYPISDREPAMVLVTSAEDAEGKSFVAGKLASGLASLGAHVLLVELDFWGRRRSSRRSSPGMIYKDPYVGEGEAGSVDLLPTGPQPRGMDPGAALRDRLANLPAGERAYNFLIMDAPPVMGTADILAAANRADEILMLVRFERTRASRVERAIGRLATIGTRPSLLLLTRVIRRHYRRYGYGDPD